MSNPDDKKTKEQKTFKVDGLIHHLKIEIPYLHSLMRREKKAELRRNDRDYQVGQHITFPLNDEELVLFKITHILPGNPEYGLDVGYCMLSLDFRGFVKRDQKGLHPKQQSPS